MMLKMNTVVVVLAILMPFKTSTQDLSFLESFSNKLTGDSYLFVGDDLKLSCVLNEEFLQENYTAHNIIFKFQFQGRGEAMCVPVSNVEFFGIDEARLVIHNVSLKNAGPYGCYVTCTHCQDWPTDDSSLVGLSDDVIVEYAPHNVINFNCVVYNWDALMTCTWQHPVEYVNKSNIEVTAIYSIPQQNSPYYKCPDLWNYGCNWSKENFISTYSYRINVTARNMKNNATTTKAFTIDPFYFVKPDPVENLAIDALEERPDCFNLAWTHSKIRRDKIYRIKHGGGKDSVLEDLTDNLTSTNYTACGYLPNTYHNFSVECSPYYNFSVETYPTPVKFGYWSDPEYISARTPMTAPRFGPRITSGCFTTTPCVDGQRNVTVMWQEVEVSAQNGIIDGYLLRLGERNLTRVAKGLFSATVKLPCYSTSVLEIFAHNEGGYSLEPSVLRVPPTTISVPRKVQDSFSVEIMSSQSSSDHNVPLRALWEVDTEIMNYTIFWCRGFPGQSCTDPIHWFHITRTQTSYDIPIPISEAEEYLYGISVTYFLTELTSGIFWTGCLFRQNPSIMRQSLKLASGMNEVQVSWVQIPCTDESTMKVTNHTVKWCQSNRCNKSESQLNLPLIVGLISGVIVLVIAVGLMWWRCNKGKHKTKKLISKEIFPPGNAPGQATYAMLYTPRNETPELDVPSINSSDSECDNVAVSSETTTASQELDSHQQDERIVQESSNLDSIQSYQHITYSPLNDSSEPSSSKQECVEYSDSVSSQSYQQVALSQSNQPSNSQNELEDVIEEDDTEEQLTMSFSDFISQSITQETFIPGTFPGTVAVTPVTSPVLQHISITLNAGAGETVVPPHHSLSHATNVANLVPDVSVQQSLTQHNTSDTSSNSGSSC